MSFLEYVGLSSILDDDSANGLFGGGLFVAGLIGWGLLAIIKPSVIDQAAMVFNLLAFIILLFITFTKIIKSVKKQKLNKLFLIISTIVTLVAFAFGLTIKYHSIIYNYEYNHLCSGIALTFIPILIINLIYPFFYHNSYEKEKVFTKIKFSLGSIVQTVFVIIACFFIGQIITIPVALLGKEEIYNYVAIFHNTSFAEKRKEIKDKTIDEFLQDSYFEVRNIFKERCINDNNQDCDKFIRDNYISWLNQYTDDYGYKVFKSKSLTDTEEIIRIVDREYGNEYYNYKINLNDFSLSKITDEEFDELYKSND